MGFIETIATDGINSILSAAIKFSGDDSFDYGVEVTRMTGEALIMMADKLADKKLTTDEINEVVAAVAKKATPEQLDAIKSALTRIFSGILG